MHIKIILVGGHFKLLSRPLGCLIYLALAGKVTVKTCKETAIMT